MTIKDRTVAVPHFPIRKAPLFQPSLCKPRRLTLRLIYMPKPLMPYQIFTLVTLGNSARSSKDRIARPVSRNESQHSENFRYCLRDIEDHQLSAPSFWALILKTPLTAPGPVPLPSPAGAPLRTQAPPAPIPSAHPRSRHHPPTSRIRTICSFSQPAVFPLVPTVSAIQPSPQARMLALTSSGRFCA